MGVRHNVPVDTPSCVIRRRSAAGVVFSGGRAQIPLTMAYPAIDIARLTVGERLGLIEQVWDSLRRDAGALALSEGERAVIEARRAEHRTDPAAAVAWDAVRAELVADQDADEQRGESPARD